jgi:hypothetical protein
MSSRSPSDKILTSIKKMLGDAETDTDFDLDLIIFINSVFSELYQMGVGPTTPFKITGSGETWSNFLGNRTDYEMVKTYVYLRTKMVFDPPTSTAVAAAFNENIKRIEWYLDAAANHNPTVQPAT